MVIAIGFDGTITKDCGFSKIGALRKNAVETIRKLQDAGHKCFLWTEREGKRLKEAKDFLESKGLVMDGYNESPYDKIGMKGRKAMADLYIDSKSVFSAESGVDWLKIERLLLTGCGDFKSRVDSLRELFCKRICKLNGMIFEKKNYGIKFAFNRHSINKIGCLKSVTMSVDNGFTPEEHFSAAEKIKDLFDKAVVVYQDYKKLDSVNMQTNYEMEAEIGPGKIACIQLVVKGIVEEQVSYMNFYLSKGEC